MRFSVKILGPLVVAVASLAALDCQTAQADWGAHVAARRSTWYPWHGIHYYPTYGQPIALVVPPTAGNTTEMGWGVGGTRITPVYHQFGRAYPNYGYDGSQFYPTPRWPSDTTQFGVHYIRAPW